MKSEIPIYDIRSISEYKRDDFLVSRFGPYATIHKNLHAIHRHNFYHIALFTEGSGTHSIDFHNLAVKPYQIYFMIPGQVHSWSFEGEVNGYVINFSNNFFQSFLSKSDFLDDFAFFNGTVQDSVIQIPEEMYDRITALFEELLLEGNGNREFGMSMVRALMLKVFILISRLNESANKEVGNAYNYVLLNNFRKLIESNFVVLKLPKDYAELLYITPNHLNALCKDLLGISAGEVIRNRIFLEAKRLLVNRDLTITEISDYLNFSDNSYFSKSFKKYVGSAPELFRKKSIKNQDGNQA